MDFVDHFDKVWRDSGREPRSPPNPDYPEGIDIVALSDPGAPRCSVQLDYPAKRCGTWFLRCLRCGFTVAVTTAGRPDDPKSITVNCRRAST